MKNNIDLYNLNLNDCLNMPFEQSFSIVKELLGEEKFNKAIKINEHYPSKLKNYKENYCIF